MRWVFTWLVLLGLSSPLITLAQTTHDDLPKKVSLTWAEANVRKGPSKKFPIVFTLHAKGIPLTLIRRHGDWREVVDWEGSKGWVLGSAISEEPTLMVVVDETTLESNPKGGRTLAILKKGVTAKILECEEQWCKVETFIGKKRGWVRKLDTK